MSRIKSDLRLLIIFIQNLKIKATNSYSNYFPPHYRIAVVAVVTLNIEAFIQCSVILKLLRLLQCQLLNRRSSFSVGQPEYAA